MSKQLSCCLQKAAKAKKTKVAENGSAKAEVCFFYEVLPNTMFLCYFTNKTQFISKCIVGR